ncbi:MAG: ATP-binding protein [Planctomycetota bacterium]|jgi:PAS domain S-box-containing protein|nr:ATP-binding protein [Planctomycetota bacterium]
MNRPSWHPIFSALEAQLSTFFPSQDLGHLMQSAGREAASAFQGQDPIPALSALLGTLVPDENGAYFLHGEHGSMSLASWTAGFLEGSLDNGTAYKVEEAQTGYRLVPQSGDSSNQAISGIRLSGSDPLTPFQMAQVLDLHLDAVLFIDSENRIRSWNRGAEVTFGYTSDEAIGEYFDLLLPQDLKDSNELDELKRLTERKGRVTNYMTRRMTKEGTELTISLTRTVVKDQSGRVIGAGVILRDITKSELLRRELEEAQSLARLGELSAQVAHEVRNPLAGIHGALQILRRRLSPAKEESDIFNDIAEEISRLDGLVTDLIRFGRPPAARRTKIGLGDWLQDWLKNFQSESEIRGVKLELHAVLNPQVFMDPQLLEQVLRNLVENSIEACPDSPQIRIESGAEAGQAWFVFSDNGPGIPESDRDKVLQPFFTTKTRGSGLGLSICSRHLHALGGHLEIMDSKSGTKVLVRLPRVG